MKPAPTRQARPFPYPLMKTAQQQEGDDGRAAKLFIGPVLDPIGLLAACLFLGIIA